MFSKLKVVWLCHMTNTYLNDRYGKELDMCAYWMTQFIDIVDYNQLEIHIVAPNYYTNADDVFENNGVYYHLYKYYSGIGDIRFAYFENSLFNGYFIKKKIETIVNLIKPDIINLFGAENITYSEGILPFINTYPCIVSFQGYIQKAELKGNLFRRFSINRRCRIEDEILSKCKHISFSEFEGDSKEFYMSKYGRGCVHMINFPFKKPTIDASSVKKEYDIVFWGRITFDKGVEDLIESVSILKKDIPFIKCLILGGGSEEYLKKLDAKVSELKIEKNIIFGGFQKTNDELFGKAAKAKVYALPTHFDALPSSIRESMLMKLPVVSYPVGDIPLLNKELECIGLARYLDVMDLANIIKRMLMDDDYRNKLIENSYKTIALYSSDEYIANQIINSYLSIVNKKN